MSRACEIMHAKATCIDEHDTLRTAAQKMRQSGIQALPVCDDNGYLRGVITDRDIVINGIAAQLDPATTTVGELTDDRPVCIQADAEVEDALIVMQAHKIRHLPVVDDRRVVGIISEADLAHHLPKHMFLDFMKTMSLRQTLLE
ncbi:putative signal-transduction protein containing cAMP-binding and CBS domains [Rhodococcus rhodochrous J45]|uniref:Putative signal-transduction protein containing cAMP-binding and CBS domains n=2 Tax=Nocardiaceae TaxID=85025 RepID=A0A562DIV1_RHORH|nr:MULTISPECIES: CBS domain-containing protein [Rhodococcus]TWH09464.1 putative signal-transduction protein containing cAMP-binding and CBS domains [Rhodococcus rhodochrous J45]